MQAYSHFSFFLLQNINCGYSLEPPRRGGSNVYLKSIFQANILKISFFFSTGIFTDEKNLHIAWACFRIRIKLLL